MEDNKLNRRSRPRPYDLRRKVLMKNFFKEQMTYIPQMQMPSSLLSSDEELAAESSDSSELKDLSNANDENTSSNESFSVTTNQPENNEDNTPIPLVVKEENVPTSSTNINVGDLSATEPKLFNFTSLLNIRKDRKKKKVTGILKAKLVHKAVKSPVKSRSFRSGLKRLLSVQSQPSKERSTTDSATRSSSKSLISMFKSQKERRKARQAAQSSKADVGSTSTSNQSVQTDDDWTGEELGKVEQSNKLLKEENRLLSESLSYFMSSSSLDSQVSACNSPLQSSNRNVHTIKRYPGCYDNLSSCSSYGYDNSDWNPRSRVLRSKSLHEHRERRNSSPHPYRTRSMNLHNHPGEFYARPMTSPAQYSPQNPGVNFRRRTVLTNLPVSNSGRVIQRRSSMPERILSENERSRVCRRSGSLRNGRTPFHSLPSEAFY